MKKFLILIVLIVGGYFAYENFLKEKEVLEVKGNLVKMKEGVDIDAPAIQPRTWGHIEGTVKNISENDVNNIEIVYKINGRESVARIKSLAAGEEVKFKTEKILLNSYEASHFLEKVNFDK
jgi:hypothetical protein